MKKRLHAGIVSLLVLCGMTLIRTSCPSSQQSVTIVDQTVVLQVGATNPYPFFHASDQKNASVSGSAHTLIAATADSSRLFEVLILKEADFAPWLYGQPVTPLYASGQTASASWNQPLPDTGHYEIVFSNRNSYSSKSIQAKAVLNYTQ